MSISLYFGRKSFRSEVPESPKALLRRVGLNGFKIEGEEKHEPVLGVEDCYAIMAVMVEETKRQSNNVVRRAFVSAPHMQIFNHFDKNLVDGSKEKLLTEIRKHSTFGKLPTKVTACSSGNAAIVFCPVKENVAFEKPRFIALAIVSYDSRERTKNLQALASQAHVYWASLQAASTRRVE